MTSGSDGFKILETYTDSTCNTGDYKAVTDDGRVWKVSLTQLSPLATGQTRGQIIGGRIYT